jgi:DNA adenine methylase
VEFTHYAKDGFTWDDQERTAEWLAGHEGPVVLVNQATDRVERLYRRLGYAVGFLEAPRHISCTGDRAPAREIMGTRNL